MTTNLSRRIGRYVTYGFENEDSKGAIAVARFGIRLLPWSPRAWLVFAKAKRSVAPESEVQIILERANKRTKGAPEIRAELVRSLLIQEKIEKAHVVVAELANVPDATFWLHLARARLAHKRRVWEEFEREIEHAIEHADSEQRGPILAEAGVMFMLVPNGDERAIETLNEAVRLHDNVNSRMALAHLLKSQDPKLANKHLMEARKLWQGSDESFHRYLATAPSEYLPTW